MVVRSVITVNDDRIASTNVVVTLERREAEEISRGSRLGCPPESIG